MNIFIYGDESGVFDKAHNYFFVFGGLIFLSKSDKEDQNRKFLHAERDLMPIYGSNGKNLELKATRLKNKHKAGLFRSTNGRIRYAFVVNQRDVVDDIFTQKKSKQRYLDFVYKVGLKKTFGRLIQSKLIDPSEVNNLYIRFDEHTTATDGKYELREAIEQEFKYGTHNFKYNTFHKPIFPNMNGTVELTFKDSCNDALIRASDIISNYVWHMALENRLEEAGGKVLIATFP